MVTASMERTASISDDGLYRYDLARRWEPGPLALWIMLNPSTADAERDDKTLRRCIGYSQAAGCGGLVIVNRYAFRSSKPADLRTATDPVGPHNEATVAKWLAHPGVSVAVAAWGAHRLRGRTTYPTAPLQVLLLARELGRSLHCLGRTKDGHPRHPLYLEVDQALELYQAAT